MNKTFLAILLWLAAIPAASAQKFKGLAPTPPMGWSTWNTFHDAFYEKDIREIADMFVSLGLKDAGYTYINLDDNWQRKRDSLGFIVPSPGKFPRGLKIVADYVHSRGLKFGVYSDAGTMTCGLCPGSLGHEYQDALVYARLGVDYLKLDWCYTKNINAKAAYEVMSRALRKAGRPVLLNICEWGSNKPWLWAKDIGHTWRTTQDLHVGFDDGDGSVLDILDRQVNLRQYAGPDHWNDPDMLQVGNGMTTSEDRAHFTMWCMLAAPLMLGNDLRTMSKATLDIITNRSVIAIDQDTLGVQGMRVKQAGGVDYWLKPLSGGDWALAILNRTTAPKDITLSWSDIDVYDSISCRRPDFARKVYSFTDLWNASRRGTTAEPLNVRVSGHDVVALRLTTKE